MTMMTLTNYESNLKQLILHSVVSYGFLNYLQKNFWVLILKASRFNYNFWIQLFYLTVLLRLDCWKWYTSCPIHMLKLFGHIVILTTTMKHAIFTQKRKLAISHLNFFTKVCWISLCSFDFCASRVAATAQQLQSLTSLTKINSLRHLIVIKVTHTITLLLWGI